MKDFSSLPYLENLRTHIDRFKRWTYSKPDILLQKLLYHLQDLPKTHLRRIGRYE